METRLKSPKNRIKTERSQDLYDFMNYFSQKREISLYMRIVTLLKVHIKV